jgi:hypothetical protein
MARLRNRPARKLHQPRLPAGSKSLSQDGKSGTPSAAARLSLLTAPLKLAGDWGMSPPDAVMRVLSRMRDVSLSGIKLFSDRQPMMIRVEGRTEGFPSIWLHNDDARLAWIVINIYPSAWCQLAYQFGHELGHVLCNSWDRLAYPSAPCQWLEESLVEAFAIRGLGRLAASWERDPPIAGDADFADSMRQYRDDLIKKYAAQAPNETCASWLRAARASLDLKGGESDAEGPATIKILGDLDKINTCVEDLGALNRWPLRSGVRIEDYLDFWEQSCVEIGTPGRLPNRLRRLFNLSSAATCSH